MLLPVDPLPAGAPLGDVVVPGSKSVTNRALLLAAMAPGTSLLRGALDADDTRAMGNALSACGIPVVWRPDGVTVHGGARPSPAGPLWLGASGTTLRFLLPWLALAAPGPVTLTGEPRLYERPLAPLLAALAPLGVRWEASMAGGILWPVAARPGGLPRADLAVDASLSSQFVTGLALALASLPEGGSLTFPAAASPSYLALTATWLARFGAAPAIAVAPSGTTWTLPGAALHPVDLALPGDWSAAAAFLAAAAVTGRSITASPLHADDQGDRAILAILAAAGCAVTHVGDHVTVAGPLRRGLHADLTLCPDLGPVLAAVAALAPAPSVLTGLHTLPLKECDRLDASAELVRWLGGEAEVEGDHTLVVFPGPPGATAPSPRPPFSPRGDHRMAFAAAVGALRHRGELTDPGCVAKTLPDFWDRWAAMLDSPR